MITKTMLLGGLLTFGAGAATQEVVLSGQTSFFAVELEVGENRVGDIFPIAPEGSVIFTYDNAEGYQASTRLESGWTNPEMKIEAGEGAIFWKEDPGTLQFTLQGNEPGQDFELHAGWNLVSEGSVSFPAGSEAGSRDGDQIVSRAGNQWQTNVYSGTTGEWETEFTPTSGRAVWFYTEAWPENPAGTFELQQALYLNPPWGLRFPRNQTGCLPENATLQVLLLTDHTMVRTQLGDLAPVDELGMVPDVANPFRYIPFHANVATNELVFFSGEEAIAVQNTGKVLPSRFVPNFPEIAAWIGSPVSLPRIVSQPVSANPELGSAAELRAVYNYPGSWPNPDPTTSLEATGCGGDADCVIQYQWLKQTGPTAWSEVPGATTSTLEIEEFKPENIGTYKLRVRWGECYEVTSSAATLGNSAPLIGLAQGNSDTGAQIFVSSFAGEKVIQGSTDLKVWTDIAASEADAWGYSIPIQEEFRFFRVKGAGAEIED